MTGGGLCVEAGGGAAEETGESRGQREIAYCVGFIKSSFLRLVQAVRLRCLGSTCYSWPERTASEI